MKPHPRPLSKGERGVICCVMALFTMLSTCASFARTVCLPAHSPPYAVYPCFVQHSILLPAPLGEGLGVRPVGVGGEAG